MSFAAPQLTVAHPLTTGAAYTGVCLVDGSRATCDSSGRITVSAAQAAPLIANGWSVVAAS